MKWQMPALPLRRKRKNMEQVATYAGSNALSHLKDQLRKIRPKLAYMSRYSMFCIRIRSRQWRYDWATSDPALSGVPCLDKLSL